MRGIGSNGLFGHPVAYAEPDPDADTRTRPAEGRHPARPVPNADPVAVANPDGLTLAAAIRRTLSNSIADADTPAVTKKGAASAAPSSLKRHLL